MSSVRSADSLCLLLSVAVLLGSLCPVLVESCPVIYVNTSSRANDSSCWTRSEAGPCSTLELALQGLWNLSREQSNCSLLVAPGTYHLHSDDFTSFTSVAGLTIACNSDAPDVSCATIACDYHEVGFSFVNSSGIQITGIAFSQCGALQKSTSSNFNSSNYDFVQFNVSLYFCNCMSIRFSQVVVQGTRGTGVVLYNTAGRNTIVDSTFNDNRFTDEAGGGLYIEFSYCDPQDASNGLRCLEDGTSNVNSTYTTKSSFLISNCTFSNNRANTSQSEFSSGTFILPHAQWHLAFGRGGGLSVFFKGNASENIVVVDGCTFDNNSAIWGAGIFAEFQDRVASNKFHVINSLVTNNHLYYNVLYHEGTGGGGSRVGFIYFDDFAAYNNIITFEACYFGENAAYFGGGVSYYSARNYQDTFINFLRIKNCTFSNNVGPLGAAVDMSLWHTSIRGALPVSVIEDTLFLNNSAVRNNTQDNFFTGMGVVYSDTMALQLNGSVRFENNTGTALAVTGGSVKVTENSSLCFENNSGRNGGGIAFFGNTYILVNRNSSLYFINNSAEYYGGAIYSYQSGEHDLISSRSCFIRYFNISADPSEWSAYFYFQENRANGKPNSIYASSLLPCIWGGPQGSVVVGDDLKNVFCWNDTWWVYNTTNNCTQEITTAPYSCQIHDTYTAIPGKTLQIQATVLDETLHNITNRTIFVAKIQQGNAHFRGSQSLDYTYISHGLIDLHGEPNSTVVIQMETLDPIVIRSIINVKLQGCPPGFASYSPDDNSTNSSVCICPGTYHNYVVCDNETFHATIARSAWIGHVPGFSDYLVGEAPYVGAKADSAQVDLTGISPESTELNTFFCNDSGRQGVMCANCQDGFGVVVNSGQFICKPCPDDVVYYHWVFYILTEFLPITIFFFAIFVLSMMVPFGPLNSYIFFAQVVTTVVKIDADGAIYLNSITANHSSALEDAYTVVYEVWNMNFLHPWLPKFCLSQHLHTLTLLSLGYVTALYPLLLLIIFAIVVSLYNRGLWLVVMVFRPLHRCLAQFRRWWNLRRSISGGIALFLVISYTKFSLASLLLLTPTPLYYGNGSVAMSVYYYQGDKNFSSPETIVYRVTASLVLATFVVLPPILLIIPSLVTFAVRFRWFRCLHSLQPHGKMQEFLDFFHGCFKDGTDGGLDCRYFAGLYFILRIALFSLYSGTATWELQYTAQMIFFLISAFLFAAIRPYKQDWVNYVDMSMFLILAAVTTLSMYNLFLTRSHIPISTWAFVLQYILLLIPFFYCVGYFLVLFCSAKKKAFQQKFLRQEVPADLLTSNQQENTPTLEDSTGIPSFLDFTHATGRLSSRMRLTDPHLWRSWRRSRRVPRTRSASTTSRDDDDDAERRPLISTSNDEQSDSESEGRLSQDGHPVTQQSSPALDASPHNSGDATAHMEDN